MPKRDDDLLSASQAAAELGLSQRRVIALIKAGRLPARKLNAEVTNSPYLIRRGDLELVRERKPGRPRAE